jgi:hypothetical protein
LGSASTALITRFFCVPGRQVTLPSSVTHSPSVVPAYSVSGRSASCAKARVRRLLAGMPRMRYQRAAPSAER